MPAPDNSLPFNPLENALKDLQKNSVAQAASQVADVAIMPSIDTSKEANQALLQMQKEVQVLRYAAQEITAQRDRANTEAAEFAARCRVAQDENKALHAALQTMEDRVDAASEKIVSTAARIDALTKEAADLRTKLDNSAFVERGSDSVGAEVLALN